jgi:hypothetical protein
MLEDPRDKLRLSHDDILSLNFIRGAETFFFRRHFRSGLRSHIMEMLHPPDVERERKGVPANGLRSYPKAVPRKMLRIFKARFRDTHDAQEEIRRVKVVEKFLAPEYMALSSEFLVEFNSEGEKSVLLCGVQEYVEGEVLDPWSTLDRDHLLSLHERMAHKAERLDGAEHWLQNMLEKTLEFVGRVRAMILDSHHVPDLAGVGNLILAPSGHIRLVDINNISSVAFGSSIPLDDRGYPVCDKSIEALSLLEQQILGKKIDPEDPIYSHFLAPERRQEVRSLEYKFHCKMESMPMERKSDQ